MPAIKPKLFDAYGSFPDEDDQASDVIDGRTEIEATGGASIYGESVAWDDAVTDRRKIEDLELALTTVRTARRRLSGVVSPSEGPQRPVTREVERVFNDLLAHEAQLERMLQAPVDREVDTVDEHDDLQKHGFLKKPPLHHDIKAELRAIFLSTLPGITICGLSVIFARTLLVTAWPLFVIVSLGLFSASLSLFTRRTH